MYSVRNITDSIIYLGGNDRRLALFENAYPIPRGVTYNSYLVKDDKNVLFDTVDSGIAQQFFENLEFALDGEKLDYVVVTHMEPDHCATLGDLILRYPDVKVICNTKTVNMIKQFFNFDIDSRAVLMNEGSTFSSGKHNYTFVMAPMVHWPEVMVVYESTEKVLFSADAFGTFGALSGNIWADECDFTNDKTWLDDARRYYVNIVGKYGPQVQALLKKAAGLDIQLLCPLHGPIWRKDIGWFIDKYNKWSTYTPEVNSVLIVYGSVYGNTGNAADILGNELDKLGVKNMEILEVSSNHVSHIISECFKYSHIVFAASTYNNEIFTPMENVLTDLKAHNFQNRVCGLIQNGTWAPQSGKRMEAILSEMKNMTILDERVNLKSSVKENNVEEIKALAAKLAESLK